MDRINLFFHYRRYIKMLARRWPLLALTCVAGTGITGYRAYKAPDIFAATSRITVAPKVTRPYNTGVTVAEELTHFYDNQIALLGSADVITRTRAATAQRGFTNPPAILETSAGRDKGNLVLSVRSTEFEFARAFSIAWAEMFLQYKSDQLGSVINNTAQRTRDDLIEYEGKLDKARKDLLEFRRRHDIAGAQETSDALQKRYDEQLKAFQDIVTMRQRLENKSKEDLADGGLTEVGAVRVKPDGKDEVPVIEQDPLAKYLGESTYSKWKLELRQKQAHFHSLTNTLKPAHPFMAKLQREIVTLSENMRYELEMIEEKRQARIKSLKLDEESYKPILATLSSNLFAAKSVQMDYDKLEEEEKHISNTLERLRSQMQAIDSTPRDESQFTIVEAGSGSPHPISPDRMKMVLTGLIAGMLGGLALMYFLDRLDDRLELAEEIEAALKEPILGQVPQMESPDGSKNIVLTRLDEHSMFAESLRGVRSAVLLGFKNERKKVLLVTSAVPGDGKTTVTSNFAITLAIAGHRVLLLDADLRRGNTHGFFGNKRDGGLSEVLQGEVHWSDVLRQTEIETLQVIHSGKLPPNPGELLISPIPAQLVEEARNEYDFIIFDCPPLTAIDDAFSLLPFCDGVVFVVRSGQTSMRFAQTALQAVRQRGSEVLGLVLNGITPDNPYYYYQHYYHRYYSKETRAQARPGLMSTPMPVRQMAPRRGSRPLSIEEAARAFSGESKRQAADSKQSKAEEFKARREAAKKHPQVSAFKSGNEGAKS